MKRLLGLLLLLPVIYAVPATIYYGYQQDPGAVIATAYAIVIVTVLVGSFMTGLAMLFEL